MDDDDDDDQHDTNTEDQQEVSENSDDDEDEEDDEDSPVNEARVNRMASRRDLLFYPWIFSDWPRAFFIDWRFGDIQQVIISCQSHARSQFT